MKCLLRWSLHGRARWYHDAYPLPRTGTLRRAELYNSVCKGLSWRVDCPDAGGVVGRPTLVSNPQPTRMH